ncbi:MAG: hypothetical protein HY276_03710, partial [Ignavibacteriales bacterium]|nr:hypothetical protein [Ignavibacteriales bacterium]
MNLTVSKTTYAGLFLVTLSTLMYEILLTRIFSVTMWYHFAFVAISVAMFGMTAGAIVVYLFPRYFTEERAHEHLALNSFLFAVFILVTFFTYLFMPFTTQISLKGLLSLGSVYVVISIPFVFSGICVSLALTKFPSQISKLYAVDLAGSAVGCILVIYALKITDGPTTVFVVAFLACLGTVFFSITSAITKLKRIAIISSVVLAAAAIGHTILVQQQNPILRLKWVKGDRENQPQYEKWNSFSRVVIRGNEEQETPPFGWGLSPAYPSDKKVKQLMMTIDAAAATVLTAYDGDTAHVEHLRYDVTNLAHYLRPDSKVLVVGTGGGRDILSALAFKQKSVVGVEINENIIDAVNRRFGDFTGHLDRDPRVTFVNDEARSYIARQKENFDIIQVSLIDTWAATAAGAFVLTENSLYTVEAWKNFLQHLTLNGVLTFSRWYFRDHPGEIYRLVSLAAAALKQVGVENPRQHIAIVRTMGSKTAERAIGVGSILVGRQPFSDEDLNRLEGVVRSLEFDCVLTPRLSIDSTFAKLLSKNNESFEATLPINIAAPTDDSPFFFHMMRPQDIFRRAAWEQGTMRLNMQAVFILVGLLAIVLALTLLCIIIPLVLTTDKASLRGATPFFIFFASIGFGFMLIEISQMQRLIIFLGHPTYSLSVVLFSLLLSSGLGSYLTRTIPAADVTKGAYLRLSILLCMLVVFGALTPHAIAAFQDATTVVRILVATTVLFVLGVSMGMAFPLGM